VRVSLVSIGAGWWWFRDFLGTLTSFNYISDAPRETLAALAPTRLYPTGIAYREAFTVISVNTAASWSALNRLIQRRQNPY
jgi:hypothetical protein